MIFISRWFSCNHSIGKVVKICLTYKTRTATYKINSSTRPKTLNISVDIEPHFTQREVPEGA
jgi:hypothetical protein